MPPTTDRLRAAPDLIAQVREQRAIREAADVAILELAVEWADRHTVDPARSVGSPGFGEPLDLGAAAGGEADAARVEDALTWLGLPTLRWDAAASFAVALGMSTASGKALIRDALVLAHRLPLVWARVRAGEVAAWRARRIAQAVLGQPDDVAAYVDTEAAPVADSLGPVLLDRLLDRALLVLHAEERELDQLDAFDRRHATLDERSIGHTGVADMHLRAEWADLAAFDDALSDVAAALSRDGCTDSLDVRRAMAVGVLADPELALVLLAGDGPAAVRPKRTLELVVHLSEANLLGIEPTAIDDQQRAILDQAVRGWAGRDDRHLRVRPVRHCGGCPDCADHNRHDRTDVYEPSGFDREGVQLRDRHCVFPYCTRPARSCDSDHTVPFDRGGPTCACNLAALCRHHHRLKTFAGWHYTRHGPSPGTYSWVDSYGQRLLRTPSGTIDIT